MGSLRSLRLLPSIQKKLSDLCDYQFPTTIDRYKIKKMLKRTWIKQRRTELNPQRSLSQRSPYGRNDRWTFFPAFSVCCFIMFLRDVHLTPRGCQLRIDWWNILCAAGLIKAHLPIRKRAKMQQVLTSQATGLQCRLTSNTNAFC